MVSSKDRTEEVTFTEDGGRPEIKSYKDCPAFRPNDDVRIIRPQRQGTFRVAQVSGRTYTLVDDRGKAVDNGAWFEESDLQLDELDI